MNKKIEITADTVLPVLQVLQGQNLGEKVGVLVARITGHETNPKDEREFRKIITELRLLGYPACATPEHGYFWGTSPAEIWETVSNLTRRSMTGLNQASKMTKLPIAHLVGELEKQNETTAKGEK